MPQIETTNTKINKFIGITLAALLILAAFFMKMPYTIKNTSYTLFREGMRQKALWSTKTMTTLNGDYFKVRYTPGNEQDATLVLTAAERFYSPIAEKYGYTGKGRIPIIVYNSRADLNRNFGWEANESAMGVYWAGVIRVLSPQVWIDEADPEMYREEFIQSGPMAHEFTHLVVDYITAGNYTRWFTEGMAQYEEYKLTGFEFDSLQATLDQPLYPLAEMNLHFDDLPNQPLAYRQSYLAVRYIAEVHGEDVLKEVLKNLASGNKMEIALEKSLGVKMKNFEENYQNWAKTIE
ncbi:peptidase MA family metallohydrolase [Desulfotomaculum sp. 1211_IL3151]|uniref:peptidase MA family metallohydrolase n=1 Tax=Desulfotomaculum sp. 1211_IL3151 TaxID=3084055 RepID=UPI002FD89C76